MSPTLLFCLWTLNLQVQQLNYIKLSRKQQRNRGVVTSRRRNDSGLKWAQRQVWHLPLPATSQPQQSPNGGAVNQHRQHRMVIYFRCSLLGCDLNFQKSFHPPKTQPTWSLPEQRVCHVNQGWFNFCLFKEGGAACYTSSWRQSVI